MGLDASEISIRRLGRVVITEGGEVEISGFEGNNCSCRDMAVLAMSHAMQTLQKRLHESISKPGAPGVSIVD